MRRSRILDGKKQQRSRAKLRKRLDRRTVERDANAEARDELTRRLDARYDRYLPLEQVEQLDLEAFLAETTDIRLSACERLRRLAIHLEKATDRSQPRAWLALRRIYDRAMRVCDDKEDNFYLLQSTAISAEVHARGLSDEDIDARVRKRLFRDAYAAALHLRELEPDRAESYSLLAQLYYNDPDGDAAEALQEADRALARDSNDFWARWYRAVNLFDLRRWSDAAAAFDAINPVEFTGNRAWRYVSLLESRAYCHFRAGHGSVAVREFHEFLDRLERDPSLVEYAWLYNLVHAATGRLKAELWDRTKAFVAEHADWLSGEFTADNRDDPGSESSS